MKKIIISTIFFLLLLLFPQITVGIPVYQKPEENLLFGEWTFLQGSITKPRRVQINGGTWLEFNCFFVHYKTHWYGNIRSGFFHHFEKITLPFFHVGWLGFHFVFARFNVALYH
jgi:hypothetical protein